jgi:hypothetical protein
VFQDQSAIIIIEKNIIVIILSLAKPYNPIIYNKYPNVYVKTVILNGKLENGSPFVRFKVLHTVTSVVVEGFVNILNFPTITDAKHAIKRPAKYIIPLISWFRIDDNVKKLTSIKGDNLYAV